jgi:hypothetical protein
MKVKRGDVKGMISQMEVLDLVRYSYEQGKSVLEKRESETLKEHGQFLTPPNCVVIIQFSPVANDVCHTESKSANNLWREVVSDN